ncbi:putative caib baif family enzyme protein [Eutypa lata UCREL1]|uniref:Putative caib baif family enzyme protein n=1 Tax=Eutypa lata (strain UCR-EL1) TaxID=1287681 RepID=M7TEA1_EUTLA|nr:putative caib baif family enzyme protein [Eutypa lata UCREL1]
MPGQLNQHEEALTPLCHIVAATGMLGYGVKEGESRAVLERLVPTGVPTAIIIDAGSTDSGPSKLALGSTTAPRKAYLRDMTQLLRLVHEFRVPLIFSSAGGDGSDEHVRLMLEIIEEISNEPENADYKFKTVAIFAGVDKTLVLDRLQRGKITGCGSAVPPLVASEVEGSPRVVAQLGPEPFTDAMRAHPDFDIIVGGRAYDPAPHIGYAAWLAGLAGEDDDGDLGSARAQTNYGAFTHVGKILECGGVCAEPKSHGAHATIYRGGVFDVTPTDPDARCTPLTVGAHTLYEKSRPDILYGPGGALDIRSSTFEQLEDGRTVRVRGSLFRFSTAEGLPYQFKLEAARVVGYRSMYMGSFHDPILIKQLDTLLDRVKKYVALQHKKADGTWEFDYHLYGKGTNEVFLVGEALASTQELATSVANIARIACIHGNYPGQRATSGNFAFGIGGKMEIECGPCAEFSVYHLMDLEPGEERFPVEEAEAAAAANGVNGHHTNGHTTNGTNGDAKSHPRLRIKHSVSLIGRGSKPAAAAAAVGDSETPAPAPTAAAAQASIAGTKRSEEEAEDARLRAAPAPSESESSSNSSSSEEAEKLPSILGDLARVRSKNAGPFEITYDAMFSSAAAYHLVKRSGLLTPKAVAAAVGLSDERDIVWEGFFDPALAYKVTAPRLRDGRRVASGSFMESDVHASQKYIGFLNMKLPEDLVASLVKSAKW